MNDPLETAEDATADRQGVGEPPELLSDHQEYRNMSEVTMRVLQTTGRTYHRVQPIRYTQKDLSLRVFSRLQGPLVCQPERL